MPSREADTLAPKSEAELRDAIRLRMPRDAIRPRIAIRPRMPRDAIRPRIA